MNNAFLFLDGRNREIGTLNIFLADSLLTDGSRKGQVELEKKGEGSTNQKELKPLTLKEMLVPVPPRTEQERIAAAITAAFSTISTIEKSLT